MSKTDNLKGNDIQEEPKANKYPPVQKGFKRADSSFIDDVNTSEDNDKKDPVLGCMTGCIKFCVCFFLFLYFAFYTGFSTTYEYDKANEIAKHFLAKSDINMNLYTPESWEEYSSAMEELENSRKHRIGLEDLRKANNRVQLAIDNLTVNEALCEPLDYNKLVNYPNQYKEKAIQFSGNVITANFEPSGGYVIEVAYKGDKAKRIIVFSRNYKGHRIRFVPGDTVEVIGVTSTPRSVFNSQSDKAYVPIIEHCSVFLK